MGTVYNENGNANEYTYMRDIIQVYHPEYAAESDERKEKQLERASKGHFTTSFILEETFSMYSESLGDQFTLIPSNATGEDFKDGSDLKTCSVTLRSDGLWKGDISGLKNKKGALRVIIYNGITKELEYYFLPYPDWESLSTGSAEQKKISLSAAPSKNGVIDRLQPYRCIDFTSLVIKR
tara:strand:- start:190 stop:729 length:540 start_codon:yes stop_codon:yes gene_type:complete